jgi:hypothetical protein
MCQADTLLLPCSIDSILERQKSSVAVVDMGLMSCGDSGLLWQRVCSYVQSTADCCGSASGHMCRAPQTLQGSAASTRHIVPRILSRLAARGIVCYRKSAMFLTANFQTGTCEDSRPRRHVTKHVLGLQETQQSLTD